MKKYLALAILALAYLVCPAAGQVGDVVVDGNGTLVEPANFFDANSAKIAEKSPVQSVAGNTGNVTAPQIAEALDGYVMSDAINLYDYAEGIAAMSIVGGNVTFAQHVNTPQFLSALGGVPKTRTITVTGPMTVNGGSTANMTSNLTIAVGNAADSSAGVVRLATNSEVQAGSSNSTSTSPSGLAAWFAWVKTQAQTFANITITALTAGNVTVTGNHGINGNFVAGDSPADTATLNAETSFGAGANAAWAARKPVSGDVADARYRRLSMDAEPTYILMREYFASGGKLSGQFGSLGWYVGGNTTIYQGGPQSGAAASTKMSCPAITSALPVGLVTFPQDGYDGAAFLNNTAGSSFCFVAAPNVASWSIGLGVAGYSGYSLPIRPAPPNSFGFYRVASANATWSANQTVAAGYAVTPTSPNGLKYIATTGGTTSASQPAWPTTYASTVADGSAVWACAGFSGGGNLTAYVSGNSTDSGLTTADFGAMPGGFVTLRIRIDTGGALYFSVNGGAEQNLARTRLDELGNKGCNPFFLGRNDTNAAGDPARIMLKFFGAYQPIP